MSISWLHFWTDGPPTPRSSTCRKTNCPRIQGGRSSITRISWPRSAPQLQVPQNQLPLTRREASIMSISWLHFWTDGPPTPRSSTCRKTNCPRIQSGRGRLSITRISWPRSAPQLQVPQNQLPTSMRIDKAGGEHHEHQLATLLDRWSPYAPKLHMPQNQLPKNTRREVEHHENQLAPHSPAAPGTTREVEHHEHQLATLLDPTPSRELHRRHVPAAFRWYCTWWCVWWWRVVVVRGGGTWWWHVVVVRGGGTWWWYVVARAQSASLILCTFLSYSLRTDG